MNGRLLPLLVVLVLSSAPAWAGTSASPEIADDPGDVNAQHAVAVPLPEDVPEHELPATPEELEVLGDILKAWVSGDSRETFSIVVELGDIPESTDATVPLAEVWVHFRVQGDDYHAVAELATPLALAADPGDATAAGAALTVQAAFELRRGSQTSGEPLAGAVDVKADTVTFILDKALVRDPGVGDKLTRFYVTTHTHGARLILDYAPGAEPLDADTFDPLHPALGETPTFGADYTFGNFLGAVPANLDVSVTPSSLALEGGSEATFAISVKNEALATDQVTLGLGNVPTGWSASLDMTQLALDPGKGRLVQLALSLPDSAAGQKLITIRLVSSLGADEDVAISVQATPRPAAGGGDGDGAGGSGGGASGGDDGGAGFVGDDDGTSDPSGDAGDEDAGSEGPPADATQEEGAASRDEDENGSSSPSLPLVVVALAAGLALARRRRG